jgi:glycosyltransferase involved in cell wall biosynthesis
VETAVKLSCLEKIHFTGYVPDDDLPVLYRDADIYVEMSRYEGFGLQVCEAMATGTVVVASDVTSLSEIVGSGGYLVPLGDVSILADKLLTLLTDSVQIKNLSKLAQQQAAQFSWEKCAFGTWTVIDTVLSKKSVTI